jgi:hypothetical protein
MAQTGAKRKFGGLKDGLFKKIYQLEIAGVVNAEPRRPAPWQRAIEKISFVKSIRFTLSF